MRNFNKNFANYRVRKAAYEQEVDASGSLAGVPIETAELPPEEPSCLRFVTTDITIAAYHQCPSRTRLRSRAGCTR